MRIFVGSLNPVKINAVVQAASETWPDVQVMGFDVPSGIPDQPWGDEETRTGAENRAKAALEDGISHFGIDNPDELDLLGVGLEGGVTELDGQVWSTVWAAVVDSEGSLKTANGARFEVPEVLAERIRRGEEIGPAIADISDEHDVRRKQGMIGIVTDGFVDRTEEYATIAKLALGLWHGRNWQKQRK